MGTALEAGEGREIIGGGGDGAKRLGEGRFRMCAKSLIDSVSYLRVGSHTVVAFDY